MHASNDVAFANGTGAAAGCEPWCSVGMVSMLTSEMMAVNRRLTCIPRETRDRTVDSLRD